MNLSITRLTQRLMIFKRENCFCEQIFKQGLRKSYIKRFWCLLK